MAEYPNCSSLGNTRSFHPWWPEVAGDRGKRDLCRKQESACCVADMQQQCSPSVLTCFRACCSWEQCTQPPFSHHISMVPASAALFCIRLAAETNRANLEWLTRDLSSLLSVLQNETTVTKSRTRALREIKKKRKRSRFTELPQNFVTGKECL